MGMDNWVGEYRALEQAGDAIMELIAERNRVTGGGGEGLKISSRIRQAQNNFNHDLTALQRELQSDKSSKKLSPKEYDRRNNMLNEAKIRKIQIAKSFEETRASGATPFGGGISNKGYQPEENERTQGYSNRELQSQQQQAMAVQDEGLARISNIVKRQKEIGLTIGDEIDGQNELIEEITDKTDETGNRINRQVRAINHVSARAGNVCGYWAVIILLFVAIISVIIWKIA
ncbi:syntaxin-8-like [Bolinopsis microptera]|uniref:syntaxin-8-like n=1 Tax=Bolinopsis microptera TaxID=2820187 RepID=UPI003079DFDD